MAGLGIEPLSQMHYRPSKMDPDAWACFGREKSLITEKCGNMVDTDLSSDFQNNVSETAIPELFKIPCKNYLERLCHTCHALTQITGHSSFKALVFQ